MESTCGKPAVMSNPTTATKRPCLLQEAFVIVLLVSLPSCVLQHRGALKSIFCLHGVFAAVVLFVVPPQLPAGAWLF